MPFTTTEDRAISNVCVTSYVPAGRGQVDLVSLALIQSIKSCGIGVLARHKPTTASKESKEKDKREVGLVIAANLLVSIAFVSLIWVRLL